MYVVANHFLSEIYVGVAKDRGTRTDPEGFEDSVADRWVDHCDGQTDILGHWRCDADNLELLGGGAFESQEEASEMAHLCERLRRALHTLCPAARKLKDYAVLETAGI